MNRSCFKRRFSRAILPPLIMGALWTILLVALFIWSLRGEDFHVTALARGQARTFFQQVVVTRSWNAAHGGVYILASEETPPNPYLTGADRDLRTVNGVLLTKVNPAYMTRQLSNISKMRDAVQFRITSLAPIRPENRADLWERTALLSFEQGAKERFQYLEASGSGQENASRTGMYRYMAPLATEKSCLECHKQAVTKAHLGGISVSFPAEPLLRLGRAAQNRNAMAYALIWGVGLVGICGFTFRLNQRREQAVSANHSKGLFLANLSHDMRTPMQSILGMSEMLEREHLGSHPRSLLRQLRHAAAALMEIINDVLDLSKIEAGRLTLRPALFSLRDCIQDCLDLVAFQCGQKGLILESSVHPDIPERLMGDSFRLRQILGNLLSNAVKFTDKGGVLLEVLPESDATNSRGRSHRLMFRVSDTGPGLRPELLPRLFERFEQSEFPGLVEQADKPIQGTGLGLAICRELVEMMGGEIWAENRPQPDSGAVFTFTLTMCGGQGATMKTAPLNSEPQSPESWRILLVEDTPAARMFAAQALEEAGHTVLQAEDMPRALELLERERCDLALVDLRLPCNGNRSGNGAELVERIRQGADNGGGCQWNPSLPVIGMSASTRERDKNLCLAAGVDAFLPKPIPGGAAGLRKAVRDVMHGRADAVSTGTPTTNTAMFNAVGALSSLGVSPELFNTMLREFMEDTPQRLNALQASFSGKNQQEALRLAHSLKNSAEMLGAWRLRHKAWDMEQALRADEVARARAMMPELEEIWGSLAPVVRKETEQGGHGPDTDH